MIAQCRPTARRSGLVLALAVAVSVAGTAWSAGLNAQGNAQDAAGAKERAAPETAIVLARLAAPPSLPAALRTISDLPTAPRLPVRFAPGTNGTEVEGHLAAGEAVVYVLGAAEGQELYVRLVPTVRGMRYRILGPDGAELLPPTGPSQEHYGLLTQSGDHMVEVRQSSEAGGPFRLILRIE